jgi:RNA polymerase sigma-70 factor (ECF subfamily)
MWLKSRQPAPATSDTAELANQPLTELPDAILVREAKQGSAAAYGELTGRYQDRIFTFVMGQIQSREDAIDLTQEVFLKAHRNLRTFRESSLFYTWLYRIAMNACIDYRRRRGRSPVPFSLDGDLSTEMGYEPQEERRELNPQQALENKELGKFIRDCIGQLPEVLRIALILHDVEGLPQKEIAEIMRCPLGTVKSRVQRARYALRDRLEPFLQGVPE